MYTAVATKRDPARPAEGGPAIGRPELGSDERAKDRKERVLSHRDAQATDADFDLTHPIVMRAPARLEYANRAPRAFLAVQIE